MLLRKPKNVEESPSLEMFKTHLDKLPKERYSLAGCSAKKPGFLEIVVVIVFISLTGNSNINFGNLGTTVMVPK